MTGKHRRSGLTIRSTYPPRRLPVQSPSTAWTSASAATAAVSARRIRGPSDSLRVSRLSQQHRALFLGKSAFRPDQDVDPVAAANSPCSACTGFSASAASSQKTSRRCPSRPVEIAIERHRLGDHGKAEDAALLGGLDDIGAHPLAVDPRDLGEAGQDRLQAMRRPSRRPSAPCSRAGHV